MKGISRRTYTGILFSLCLTVLLGYSLYHRGLFFAPEQVYVSVVILVVFILGLLLLVISRQFNPTIWVLPMCLYGAYVLLSTLWSVNRTSAVGGAVVVIASLSVALIATQLQERWRPLLLTIVSVSGGMVFLFALLVGAGVFHYQDAISGNMMSSVFQYHNTFGSFELATGFVGLAMRLSSSRKWVSAIYSISASLCLAGVIASYSRWVWILTVVILALYIIGTLVLRQGFQAFTTLVVVFVTTAGTTLFALRSMHQASLGYAFMGVLIALIGGVLEGWLTSTIITHGVSRKRRIAIIAVPVLVSFVAIAIMVIHPPAAFKSVVTRAHAIQFTDFSLQERLWYYGAAVHMWLDHALFGTGIGTWSTKFQAYQQFPYWTTQTHSVLMNELVNFGSVGTLLWALMGGCAFYLAIREILKNKSAISLAAVLGATTLLVHALFDFDMDYPVVVMLFFLLLVLGGLPRMTRTASEPERASAGVYLPMLSGVVVLGVFGTLLALSEVTQQKATQTKNLDQQISLLRKSLKYASYNDEAQLQLVNAEWEKLVQTQSEADRARAWTDIQRVQRTELWNPSVQDFTAITAYQLGHYKEALQWSQQAFADGPFSSNYPELYMSIALRIGVGEDQLNQVDAKEQWKTVLNTYGAVEQNVKAIADLPKDVHAERPYNITPQMQTYKAAAEFCMKDYKQSLQDVTNPIESGASGDAADLGMVVKVLDQMRLGLISNQQFAQVFEHVSKADQQQYQVLSNIK